jgi:hypothetical protein
VELAFVLDISVHAVPHGPDGLVYFLQHGTETDVFTNLGVTAAEYLDPTARGVGGAGEWAGSCGLPLPVSSAKSYAR